MEIFIVFKVRSLFGNWGSPKFTMIKYGSLEKKVGNHSSKTKNVHWNLSWIWTVGFKTWSCSILLGATGHLLLVQAKLPKTKSQVLIKMDLKSFCEQAFFKVFIILTGTDLILLVLWNWPGNSSLMVSWTF